MWSVIIKRPDDFHRDAVQVLQLSFDKQPTLKTVLDKLAYPDDGVRALSWGDKNKKLTDLVEHEELLVLYYTWEDEHCGRLKNRTNS